MYLHFIFFFLILWQLPAVILSLLIGLYLPAVLHEGVTFAEGAGLCTMLLLPFILMGLLQILHLTLRDWKAIKGGRAAHPQSFRFSKYLAHMCKIFVLGDLAIGAAMILLVVLLSLLLKNHFILQAILCFLVGAGGGLFGINFYRHEMDDETMTYNCRLNDQKAP